MVVVMETTKLATRLRCRRCRKCVMDPSNLLLMSKESDVLTKCNVWHVNFDPLPDWILRAVSQARWTKGRLLCPHCTARLGGFDFVHRASCSCGQRLTVHLSESRVDHDHVCVPAAVRTTCHSYAREPAPQEEAGEALSLNRQLTTESEPVDHLEEPLQTYSMIGEEGGLHGGVTGLPSPTLRHRDLSEIGMEDGDGEEGAAEEPQLSRKERNRVKSLRRKLRQRERWLHTQRQELPQQGSARHLTSSDEDEGEAGRDREGLTCAVCLDVYFSPYMCQPCGHVFCEPCLRTLAKNCPKSTPCPLCRTTVSHVFFQSELSHACKTHFPKEYVTRKQSFQKANCAKWPLPSCRKIFHVFDGFRRHSNLAARRRFPHDGYQPDGLAFHDDSQGWRFDMDVLIIYVYSINWLLGFVVLCFLCYVVFSSL